MKHVTYALACFFMLYVPLLSGQEKTGRLSATEWTIDLSWLVKQVETVHPAPFTRVTSALFHAAADSLRSDIPRLSDARIAGRMMQLVALLRDGHTNLSPVGLNRWFPLRCYAFTDGLFVCAIDRNHREFVGSKVLRYGTVDASAALEIARSWKGADNRFGELENSVLYLSNADLLRAFGVIDTTSDLTLEVERPDGKVQSLTLASRTIDTASNWMQWGEMYGPMRDLTTFFGDRVSGEFRKGDSGLPLHMRMRLPFWFEYLKDSRTVYCQFNFVEKAWNGETFQRFTRRLFSCIDSTDVRKLVLDIRYNSGGDGSILDPFLHEIIKRDKINEKGKFFVLVGRKTFSAAVMLLGSLKRHTNAYFVGEPAGAPLNHYGDPQEYVLPNSKFVLQLSTVYNQAGNPSDNSSYFPIDFPYQFTSHDYFSGSDPALELVLKSDPRTLCDMLLQGGHDPRTLMEGASEMAKRYAWFAPFSEREMNSTGYRLLEEGRVKEAIAAFSLNAEASPSSWNVWDSLAESYMDDKNTERAIECYIKSLDLNPGNQRARDTIEKLRRGK